METILVIGSLKKIREALSMQDMVGGDNNRTPVIFQVSDNLVFVGGNTVFSDLKRLVIYIVNL